MPNQRDVQQLIQSLTPGAVNNGNPNTIYNQPRQSTPPPVWNGSQWLLNSINPAASTGPTTLSYAGWQAPANSLQPNLPQWPTFQQPQQGGGAAPSPTPVPAPTPQPPTQTPIGGSISSGGGGAFGDIGCVAIDQEIYGFVSPEAVEVGDIMPTVNPHTFEMTKHVVSYSETKLQPCLVITTESGAELKCSESAPLLGTDSIPILAKDVKVGTKLAVYIDGMFDFSTVASVEHAGNFNVQHITCGNQYFLAGNGNGKYILHHNVKFAGPEYVNLYAMMDELNNRFGWSQNSGGGVSTSANTRGAMQANGTWDTAHGGTAGDPATAWGNSQTGWNGSLTEPAAGWNGSLLGEQQANAIGGTASNAAVNPWANLPAPTSYSNLNMPSAGAQMPTTTSDTSSLLDKAANLVDNNLLGNMYDENSNSWNGANVGWGILTALTGIPFDTMARKVAMDSLMKNNGGIGADYARTQTQQAYDRSPPDKQASMLDGLAKTYGMTVEQVRALIGR